MRQSDLVKFKNTLEDISFDDLATVVRQQLKTMSVSVNSCGVDYNENKQNLLNSIQKIQGELRTMKVSYDQFFDLLQQDLDRNNQRYIDLGNEIYENGKNDTAEYILSRFYKKDILKDETQFNYFVDRVRSYVDWKFPGLQLRPAHGRITDHLKGCDPLYLVDTDKDLFNEVKTMFSKKYQARLRYYTCSDSDNHIMNDLPAGQFGLVVAFDFFNFKPIYIIQRYLESIFKLLRPGGTVIFTYNNCDRYEGVINVENFYACWAPGREVVDICKRIGYEITFSCDQFDHISWLEVRKPGELTSTRGGQTLGKIQSLSE